MSENKQIYQVSRRVFVGGMAASAALLAGGALVGCGKKEQSGDKTAQTASSQPSSDVKLHDGGTMKYYINNPRSIDPMYAQELYGIQIDKQLFDPLTAIDPHTGELIPRACESWESSPDAQTFTFHIRKGATFHNGEPVTARDFKFAWERLCSSGKDVLEPSPVSYHISLIKGYEDAVKGTTHELSGLTCPDDYTLVVALSQPYADFPYITMHPVTSPVPSSVASMDPKQFGLAPIGNGPFKMDGTWVDGQYIKLVRNDAYYGKPAHFDGIEYHIFNNQETAFREFQAGNLDLTQIPAGQASTVLKTYGQAEGGYEVFPGKQVVNGAKSSSYFFPFNMQHPALSDKRIRQALNLAINRQAICETVFQGLAVPADNVIPPKIEGYQKGAWKYCTYDPDRARALLKEVGHESDLKFTLTVNEGADQKQVAELIQADLAQVGVTISVQQVEYSAMNQMLNDGSFEICRAGWGADYPVMDNFLYPLFFTGLGDNYARYSNKDYDERLEKARKTVDKTERIKEMQACNEIVAEDCPVLLVSFPTIDYVLSDRVYGAIADGMGFWHFDDAYLIG